MNLNNSNAVLLGLPAGYVPPPITPIPGRLTNTTIGVNWIWNQYAKVQFDAIYSQLDNAVFGNSTEFATCSEPHAERRRRHGVDESASAQCETAQSKTARTLALKLSLENGFCRNGIPDCSTPSRKAMSSV